MKFMSTPALLFTHHELLGHGHDTLGVYRMTTLLSTELISAYSTANYIQSSKKGIGMKPARRRMMTPPQKETERTLEKYNSILLIESNQYAASNPFKTPF
jgi:hypothetical protein